LKRKWRAATKATGFVLWELIEFLVGCYVLFSIFSGSFDLERAINEQPFMAFFISLFFGGIAFWVSGAWIDKFGELLKDGSERREVSKHS
jgi:hypothetical protein